jgi:hypothetical protein
MDKQRPNLSQAYYDCLRAATEHHATSKTYSGKLFRPHANYVKGIIDRLECKSVLDYGCGKGSQYTWISNGGEATVPSGLTIEQFWGLEVYKFDPAWPPYSKVPEGYFDLVVCTHTLGSIPVQDLDEITYYMFSFARKAIYVAEKIGAIQKQVYNEVGVEMPHGWSPEQWEALLRRHAPEGVEVTLATRTNGEGGSIITRKVIS